MTREDFCKRCSRYAGCGFISRNLQTKCDILQIFEEGYEQAIDDAVDWLEKHLPQCIEIEEDFVVVNYGLIADFEEAMKGE